MALIKKTNQQVLVRMWRDWNCHTLLVGKENGMATLGKSSAIPSKVRWKLTM